MDTYPADATSVHPHDRLVRLGDSADRFWLTGEDNLVIVVRNAVAGVTVTTFGRLLDICGTIVPFVFDMVPASDRSVSTQRQRLGTGWILDISARVTAGAPLVGQTAVQVRVNRGEGTVSTPIGTLLQGYVTPQDDLAYPQSTMQPSIYQAGFISSVSLANPGLGTDFSLSVPAHTRWRFRSARFAFVTGATVANREMVFIIDDGANELLRIPAGQAQAASLTQTFTLLPGVPKLAGAQDTSTLLPGPDLTMLAGFRLRSATNNLQATDQYQTLRFVFEEWIEN